jgi:hypothetical protein
MVLSIIFLEEKHKHGYKMHVKEIYVIFIHLLDSGKLLIINLNKKKRENKGGGVNFICEFYS